MQKVEPKANSIWLADNSVFKTGGLLISSPHQCENLTGFQGWHEKVKTLI